MSEEIIDLLDRMQNEDADQRMQNLPREERWRSIPRDAGETLAILARLSGAQRFLEIGTSQGYSTIWLGLTASGNQGSVDSFEVDEKRLSQARKNITKANLTDFVSLIKEDFLTYDLGDKEYDFVFLDAEKEDYVKHFNKFFPKLREGGVIVADNVVSHFADLREYVEMVRNHEQCNSTLLSSVGSGLEITYKMKKEEPSELWNTLIR